MTITPTTLEPT